MRENSETQVSPLTIQKTGPFSEEKTRKALRRKDCHGQKIQNDGRLNGGKKKKKKKKKKSNKQ